MKPIVGFMKLTRCRFTKHFWLVDIRDCHFRFTVHKFILVWAFNALNLINPAGWVYNRTGIRFLANDKWNFMIGIKAHVGIADYLEWGLGYRL